MPVQEEAFRAPNSQNQKSKTKHRKKKLSCHVIIKTVNTQNRVSPLKAARDKQHAIIKTWLSQLDYSAETLKAWNGIYQVLKDNSCQPRILYPAKLSVIIEGKIKRKTFNGKNRLKEFMSTKPSLQKMLIGTFLTKEKTKSNHKATEKSKPC